MMIHEGKTRVERVGGRRVYYAFFFALLLSFVLVHAETGLTTGETILDSVSQISNTAYNALEETGNFVNTGVLIGIKATSTLTNSFFSQFQNKEQGQSQNSDVDIAQSNLENSKQNVATMFFFIVSTFVIFFDMIVSMFYLIILVITVWVVFVGYVKFLIMIIDAISGRLEKRGFRK